jgi:hypothetical protein
MMRIDHRENDLENHDRGLDYDLPRLLGRRGLLKLVAGAGFAGTGLITLGACADATSTADTGPAQGSMPPRGGPGGGAAQPTQTSDTANGRFRRKRPVRTQAMARTARTC